LRQAINYAVMKMRYGRRVKENDRGVLSETDSIIIGNRMN
jgi:hypothetical protein